jgi:hypothetical protein
MRAKCSAHLTPLYDQHNIILRKVKVMTLLIKYFSSASGYFFCPKFKYSHPFFLRHPHYTCMRKTKFRNRTGVQAKHALFIILIFTLVNVPNLS